MNKQIIIGLILSMSVLTLAGAVTYTNSNLAVVPSQCPQNQCPILHPINVTYYNQSGASVKIIENGSSIYIQVLNNSQPNPTEEIFNLTNSTSSVNITTP
ncbi:MAG: hypothetical protein ABR981_02995 [Candidatus Micrarchaeaceae archaeon]|jgi:hypothetical protein